MSYLKYFKNVGCIVEDGNFYFGIHIRIYLVSRAHRVPLKKGEIMGFYAPSLSKCFNEKRLQEPILFVFLRNAFQNYMENQV